MVLYRLVQVSQSNVEIMKSLVSQNADDDKRGSWEQTIR